MTTAALGVCGVGAYLSIGALCFWLIGGKSDEDEWVIAVWPLVLVAALVALLVTGIPGVVARMVNGEDWRGWFVGIVKGIRE